MNPTKDISEFCISKEASIRDVMQVIDRNKEGIALVVDENKRLIGSITDGDIRRFLIANRSLEETADKIMYMTPISAHLDSSESEIRSILKKYRVRNVPLIDKLGRPKRLVSFRDFLENGKAEPVAVIMAGGEGKRLRPLTEQIPKPMLKVADKPVLENIIQALAVSEIRKIYISVNYKADAIEGYLKDGAHLSVAISYLREKKKLGTAGALTLLPEIPKHPFLVINGDIMTKIDLRRLLDFHQHHRCVMTIGAVRYRVSIPYGVLNLAGHYVLDVEEKPKQQFFCNAGIYALNPEALQFIPTDTYFDMTELMKKAIHAGLPVGAFPIHESWIDIGKMTDLQQARLDFSQKENESQKDMP